MGVLVIGNGLGLVVGWWVGAVVGFKGLYIDGLGLRLVGGL